MKVQLVHAKPAEAADRAAKLRAAGYRVDVDAVSPGLLRQLRRDPPAAVVIDLGRAPSMGRDLALWLRKTKATRRIPLVVVEGDPKKTAAMQRLVPDAVYTPWSRVRGSLKRAIARPPAEPVVPDSTMAGYSGTPLPKKLGIKPCAVVALVSAPDDFEQTLGTLPDEVTLRRQARGRCDLIVWFTRSQGELRRRVQRMGQIAGKDGLWIAWPKQSSAIPTDLNQTVVRRTGLDAGLVDYKICAIDADWSGLKFTRRKAKQGRG